MPSHYMAASFDLVENSVNKKYSERILSSPQSIDDLRTKLTPMQDSGGGGDKTISAAMVHTTEKCVCGRYTVPVFDVRFDIPVTVGSFERH
jgi:hypothetical protein